MDQSIYYLSSLIVGFLTAFSNPQPFQKWNLLLDNYSYGAECFSFRMGIVAAQRLPSKNAGSF